MLAKALIGVPVQMGQERGKNAPLANQGDIAAKGKL